jgi:hypothetical protein
MRDFCRENRPVTVRQVYYHFVSEQILASKIESYNLTKRLLTSARMSGFIKFEWITDDTRHPEKTSSWRNMKEILDFAVKVYRSDWQACQSNYVEVWLEKRTLRRIFLPITDKYDVFLCVGGGYQSTDFVHDAAQRMKLRAANGHNLVILYFGDLNPSGKDMLRDVKARLAALGVNVEMKEVALTKQDVEEHNLPRNPSKPKDVRIKWFIDKYGITYSVELDALPPQVLRGKLESAIKNHLDLDQLEACRDKDRWEKSRAKNALEAFYREQQ